MDRNYFFAHHLNSSVMHIRLFVHAVMIVLALFVFAVTVIQKTEVGFEVKEVKRPRIKLQVPVNVNKYPQQPKLRKKSW